MPALERLLSSEVLRALGWALLHSLWQGLAVALGLAFVLAKARFRSPNSRYVAAFSALFVALALPAGTAVYLSARAGYATATLASLAPRGESVAQPPSLTADVERTAGAPVSVNPKADGASGAGGKRSSELRRSDEFAAAGGGCSVTKAGWYSAARAQLERLLPYTVLAWALGVLLFSLRLLIGWLQVRRMRSRGARELAARWQERIAQLGSRLRVTRPVRVLESALIEVPTVIGWMRPVILLPATVLTGLTLQQLELILAHELAHIRRYDYLANLIQTVAETLLFHHPAVWWISRRVRAERENCCDDLAVATCGDSLVYARTLAELEGLRHAPALAAAAAGDSPLVARVDRLLGRPAPRNSKPECWLGGVIALATLVFLALGLEGSAQAGALVQRYRPVAEFSRPTSTVTGVVKDAQGRAIAGAVVMAQAFGADGDEAGPPQQTRADGAGQFELANLSQEGYWSFCVDDPRYAKQWNRERMVRIPVQTCDLPIELRVQTPQKLAGTVVDEDGAAVEGATVTLVREFPPGSDEPIQGWLAWDLQVTHTDKQGRFVLERLRAGRVVLMLDGPGFARTLSDLLEVPGPEVKTTIARGLTLHGRVSSGGQPLTGVGVQVNATNLAHRSLGCWHLTTDAAGEFTVEHVTPFREYFASITSLAAFVDDEQWTSPVYQVSQTSPTSLPVLEIDATRGQEAEEQRGAVSVGGVKAGEAEAGASGESGQGTIIAQLDPKLARSPADVVVQRQKAGDNHVWRQAAVDDNGVARFENLPAGTYSVMANTPGGPNYVTQQVVLKDAVQTIAVQIEKGPGRIRGVIRCEGKALDAAELKGAQVFSTSLSPLPGGGQTSQRFNGRVEADGTLELDGLRLGHHEVYLQLHHAWPHFANIDVRDDQTQLDIDLPQRRIIGTATPHAAEEFAYVIVHRHDEDPFIGARQAAIGIDTDGRFAIDHVPPGFYALAANQLGTTRPAVATLRIRPEDADIHVECVRSQDTGWIAGRVRGIRASTQRGQRGPVLAIPRTEVGYMPGTAYMGSLDDTYRIEDVPVGTYALRLGPQKLVPLIWTSGVEVRAGMVCELDIDVPEGRPVSVKLTWGENPPARALWRLRLPDGAWLTSDQLVGTVGDANERLTAAPGEFVLPLGDYLIEADFGEGVRVARQLNLTRGEGVQEVAISAP